MHMGIFQTTGPRTCSCHCKTCLSVVTMSVTSCRSGNTLLNAERAKIADAGKPWITAAALNQPDVSKQEGVGARMLPHVQQHLQVAGSQGFQS